MSKWNRYKWQSIDDEEPSLVEEAEQLSRLRDPYESDIVYFEDAHVTVDEVEVTPQSQPPPLLIPRNKKMRVLHQICGIIVQRYNFLSINGEQMVWFIPDEGCYRTDGLPEVALRRMVGSNEADLMTRDMRDILEIIKYNPFIQVDRDDFNCEPCLINTRSGVLDWELDEVEAHSKDDRFTYCIDAEYLDGDSSLKCPAFDAFCKTSLEGVPEKRLLLLEIIGYCCSDSNAGKCAFFLKGEPDSGKSVMLEFITRLLGQQHVSNVPLHKLSERFMRAELYGKKLNCAGEIVGKALREISTFKSITGSDRIEAERKGQDPFFFTPRCKLLFAGNTLPGTTESDATKAFTNRLVILLFTRGISKEEQDKHLLEKLIREKNSIFTLAIQALQELALRNFQFTVPADSADFIQSFAERESSLKAFWKTSLDKGTQGKEAKKVLPTLHKTPPTGTIGGVFVCGGKSLNPGRLGERPEL